MNPLKEISVVGMLAGFVVVVATSIVLSIVSPFIFSGMVRSGDLDALVTSPGPLGYALGVIFVSSAFGVIVCSVVADKARWIDAILVVALYGAFTYLLSRSPSNQATPYPGWYVLISYIVLVTGAVVGYFASRRLVRDKKRVNHESRRQCAVDAGRQMRASGP